LVAITIEEGQRQAVADDGASHAVRFLCARSGASFAAGRNAREEAIVASGRERSTMGESLRGTGAVPPPVGAMRFGECGFPMRREGSARPERSAEIRHNSQLFRRRSVTRP
jgi:hypothetical protein